MEALPCQRVVRNSFRLEPYRHGTVTQARYKDAQMGRILVIEDEVDLQQVLDYNLRQAGHEVVAAVRAQDGLRLAAERRPDLVVLDLMLPDFSGTEVCKALKRDSRTRHIPVLMLTAKGEEIDRILGFELGAEDY